ncbi:hypothetical protein D9M68_461230 [compost metagenome]
MGHAANFGDALLETCLVAGEVVANQLAIPRAKEVARMLTCTARAEVVNHGFEGHERRSAVGPDVGTVGFLLARREHLHRRFVGVNHGLGQYRFAQRIDQGLELHAGLADPLRQR